MTKRTKKTTDFVVGTKSGGKTVSAICIQKALAKSLTIFKPKRSTLSSQDWFLYRDNAAVHTATSV
jgi:ribosomal protein S9